TAEGLKPPRLLGKIETAQFDDLVATLVPPPVGTEPKTGMSTPVESPVAEQHLSSRSARDTADGSAGGIQQRRACGNQRRQAVGSGPPQEVLGLEAPVFLEWVDPGLLFIDKALGVGQQRRFGYGNSRSGLFRLGHGLC